VHNRFIYIAIIGANLVLAAYLLLNDKPEVGLTKTPIEFVGEKSIKLLVEGAALSSTAVATSDEAQDGVVRFELGKDELGKDEDGKNEASEIGLANVVATETAVAAKVCRIWGPVGRQEDLSELTTSLDTQGGFPEVFTTQIESQPDYLVYVEAYESIREAKRIGKELDAASIENYVIRRDQGPIVSTGVFSTLARAESHQEKLKSLDFPVAIEILERQQDVYSLRGFVELQSQEYLASISDCATIAQSR
jgi:hypothetical protein